MKIEELDDLAATAVKQGPLHVESIMQAMPGVFAELKREFHYMYPGLILRDRGEAGEQAVLRGLIIEMHRSIIRATERYWRHCDRPVKAKSVAHPLTGALGIHVKCRCCTKKQTLYGGN